MLHQEVYLRSDGAGGGWRGESALITYHNTTATQVQLSEAPIDCLIDFKLAPLQQPDPRRAVLLLRRRVSYISCRPLVSASQSVLGFEQGVFYGLQIAFLCRVYAQENNHFDWCLALSFTKLAEVEKRRNLPSE